MFSVYSALSLLLLTVIHASNARETVQDAALIARQLVESPLAIGSMATVYPANYRDPTLAGQPFALQEYYASCYQNGSLTLILMPISRHTQNILTSAAHSASITVWSSPPSASRARVSLVGNFTVFRNESPSDVDELRECYLKSHPDAVDWLPENEEGPHTAYWSRFDIQSIYFVGGFGDEHYIGGIPVALYQEAQASSAEPVHWEQSSYSLAGRIVVQDNRNDM